MDQALPAIPAKRYFTIGEVSELCGVKPYVLRYWEQEFSQLRPMKRRGNRRYYQHHEVLLVRRIRGLLYDQGFTISGARNQLDGGLTLSAERGSEDAPLTAFPMPALNATTTSRVAAARAAAQTGDAPARSAVPLERLSMDEVRAELLSIRSTLLV